MGLSSPLFLIFLTAVLVLYLLVPGKLRATLLVTASYVFALSFGFACAAVLFVSTLVTYLFGLLLEKNAGRHRIVFASEVVLHVLAFGFFKYYSSGILLPVGYSFYTFQALGYLADVYRGDMKAERNFLNFALFQGFFPKLVQGPIESGGNLLVQIRDLPGKNVRDPERIRRGALLIMWGLFEKIFIADRIAIPVNAVYSQFGAFGGVEIVLVTLLYAFQIYCDFAGYTDIARGAAGVFGIDLGVNFRRPYMAASVREFWRRWHISLSTWLRNYIYIPLGGGRKGRLRKYANLLITFIISGIWHGTGAHFLAWGLAFAVLQIAEDVLRFDERRLPRWAKRAITFVLVDVCWMLFRANSIGDVTGMVKVILTNFALVDFKGMELTVFEWVLLAAGIAGVIVKDVLNEKGVCLTEAVLKRPAVVRCLLYTCVAAAVIVLGVYGAGYDTTGFLYTNF